MRSSWRCGGQVTGAVVTVLLAAGLSWGAADPCQAPGTGQGPGTTPPPEGRAPDQPNEMSVPIGRLDPEARCPVEAVIKDPTTTGQMGPVRIPIASSLYEYLLDHPVLMASLVRRLGLGVYEFSVKGPNQFWGNDGDGTQGLLTRVYRDQATRVYSIDGFHEGRLFPSVRVKGVVLLHFAPARMEGRPSVDISLVAYTKLNDPVLSAIVFMLRPLIGEGVTKKITRAFEVTNQLGTIMAEEPDRVLREMQSLALPPEEQQALTAHLRGMAPDASKDLPASAPP